MSEYQHILPSSWLISSLGEICSHPQYGYTTKAVGTGNLKLLRTTDITSGNICWEDVPFCSENPLDEAKYLLHDGDIVISRAGSVGVSYLLNNPERSVFASYLIRFKPYINKQYFKYFLDSAYYWREISENKLGIAVPNVNANKLRNIQIPLPPLLEQQRIVAKIDELFSELDKGIESLKTARQQIKVYRQALLKHAFEGDLTAEWREENQDNLETADALLGRIQRERAERYAEQLTEWMTSGSQGSKPKAPKKVPSLTTKELAELPELPDGWIWVKSGELFEFVTSGSRGWATYYSEAGAIFIRITNLDFNSLHLDLAPGNIQYVRPPHGAEGMRTRVNEGDFLFSITGYLGMFAIAPSLKEAYINQHIALARPVSGFSKSYFGYFVTSETGGIRYLNKQTKGAVKAGLGLDDIQNFPVPICALNEQVQISSELEWRLSIADQLDQTITDSLQQAEAMRQSILKKAFSGQLVPQNSDDEPASVLLERIKAEKAGSPAAVQSTIFGNNQL